MSEQESRKGAGREPWAGGPVSESSGPGAWIGKLEAEIARELGQTISLAAGGEAPDSRTGLFDAIELPGARLTLLADSADAAAVLAEGRVVEAGTADGEMVRELWSGILSSVAARLGGKSAACGPIGAEGRAEPCTLRLGSARMRMAIAVETTGREAVGNMGRAETPVRSGHGGERPAANFDLLLEVELDASVRFGSCEMELKDLLELGPGDVVELDRHVADPVDLIVGDRIVARGEVVLVNGNFGLRVTEVAEPMRRLESIRCL